METIAKKDITTVKRFEMYFGAENIRSSSNEALDITKNMTSDLIEKVETQVTAWLDNNGAEYSTLELDLFCENNEYQNRLLFSRSEICLRTCSNNWEVIHVADSSRWPRLLASRPKLTIQTSSSFGDMAVLRNEVKSFNFDKEYIRMSEIASNIKERQDGNSN